MYRMPLYAKAHVCVCVSECICMCAPARTERTTLPEQQISHQLTDCLPGCLLCVCLPACLLSREMENGSMSALGMPGARGRRSWSWSWSLAMSAYLRAFALHVANNLLPSRRARLPGRTMSRSPFSCHLVPQQQNVRATNL